MVQTAAPFSFQKLKAACLQQVWGLSDTHSSLQLNLNLWSAQQPAPEHPAPTAHTTGGSKKLERVNTKCSQINIVFWLVGPKPLSYTRGGFGCCKNRAQSHLLSFSCSHCVTDKTIVFRHNKRAQIRQCIKKRDAEAEASSEEHK